METALFRLGKLCMTAPAERQHYYDGASEADEIFRENAKKE